MNKFVTVVLLVVLLVATAGSATAGGQFLPLRGVRPSGRGGAFVAGADDLNALWWNPAGLAALAGGDTRMQFLLDVAWAGHDVAYTRVDSGGIVRPTVENQAQFAPLPTLAAGFDLGDRLVLAIGFVAPYSALDGYPEDGAQRYAMVSQHNSLIGIVEVALAWKPNEVISVGVGLQNMNAKVRSRVVFGTCPRETVCAPEDPEFDALGEIEASKSFIPSAVAGVQLRPIPEMSIGAAVQLPFDLETEGTIRVRLPSTGFFNGARIEGDTATIATRFPAMARFGVEMQPAKRWKVEGGVDWEMWSMQDAIRVTPHDVRVVNAAGVGTYEMGPITIPRKLEDTFAVRLGLETQPSETLPLTLRAGYVFETSAAPDAYLSVLTVDAPKHVLTAGVSWRVGKLRFDATYAHVFMGDRDIGADVSCVPLVNPIRSGEGLNPEECVHDHSPDHVYVGEGAYRSSWNVVGVGVAFDH